MRSVLHYPGSKKRIAPWIIENMPRHHSYLEPFFGGGAVLFEKEPSRIETVNDIDGDVINFFRVIQNPESRVRLQKWIAYTPYARDVYEEAFAESDDPVERAGKFAVRSMQGFGFRTGTKDGWKRDGHGREAAYAVRNFNDLPEAIAGMAARLKQVQIENRPALEVIRSFNHENVLIYADPPYAPSTRTKRQYRYEMTEQDHKELLQVLTQSKAKVMISGYDCELYEGYLHNWRKKQIPLRTRNASIRTETIWMNYPEEAGDE